MSTRTSTAIYDFSVLPYALGDILTWSMNQQCKAIEYGIDGLEVVAYSNHKRPSSIHQDKFIKTDNYKPYLFEVIQAFYCNPMLNYLRIVHDAEFMPVSYQSPNPKDFIEINRLLQVEVASHQLIIDHHKTYGSIPSLICPQGHEEGVQEIITAIRDTHSGPIVLVHFRMRSREANLGLIEPHRDGEYVAWLEFIAFMSESRPDVAFVFLGRIKEKPPEILCLDNVFFPRCLGYSLAHELGLFHYADMFMGTCSGFAEMAFFTKIPYRVTKADHRSIANLCLQPNQTVIDFAHPNQELVFGNESFDLLRNSFNSMENKIKEMK